MRTWSNKSLQATRDDALSSASRFTPFGPACLSSGRSATVNTIGYRYEYEAVHEARGQSALCGVRAVNQPRAGSKALNENRAPGPSESDRDKPRDRQPRT